MTNVRFELLARSKKTFIVLATTLGVVAAVTAEAQPIDQRAHRHTVERGDVVVRTGRSYLNPGTNANVGTENRYFSDTTPYSYSRLGPTFSGPTAGFELLPDQFNPPGRPEPLFKF